MEFLVVAIHIAVIKSQSAKKDKVFVVVIMLLLTEVDLRN